MGIADTVTNHINVNISELAEKKRTEKILMFGEGNFLRAFIGPLVQRMNENGGFGSIVALQGTEKGLAGKINKQKGAYTVVERGYQSGRIIENAFIVNSVSRCINPYNNYEDYLALAANRNIRVIVSNTTEFGICYEKGADVIYNFPMKLTDWLYKRYKCFGGDADSGMLILPCELIDRNGDKLLENVLRYADDGGYGVDFKEWLKNCCNFCNTLVDRIVSGYPFKEESEFREKLGYYDELIDICEPFFLWVIESKKPICDIFPAESSGYNVIVTDDLSFFRERKVRILNGAHTATALLGHLAGFETVEQIVNDGCFYSYMTKLIRREIMPNIEGDMSGYADEVIDRFRNPFLNHKLLSIALNSVSKIKSRLLVSLKDYILKFGKCPELISFSFAGLIEFYFEGTGNFANDEKKYLERFGFHREKAVNVKNYIEAVLSDKLLWDENLGAIPGFTENVVKYTELIKRAGASEAVRLVAQGLETVV